MRLFRQKTEVHLFNRTADFAREIQISSKDFILASRSAYEKYFLPLNLDAHVFYKSDYGKSEPTDLMVDALISDFIATGCDRIIAIGGGSVIDMAKILVVKDVTNAKDVFLRKIPIIKAHELVAVPTTCGAGSEVSAVSIISATARGTKVGLADEALIPDYAMLIPELLTEMPYEVFVTSAIDALIHALESYVCPKANYYSDLFCVESTRLIVNGFRRIIHEGEGVRQDLLQDFLLASNMAGIAFSNAGTGAVHAMSYPLSGQYNVTHGEACYQLFTSVFQEYHRVNPDGKIRRIESLLADILQCDAGEVFFELEEILNQIVPRHKLRDYGMCEADVELFVDNVFEMQQRLLAQSYVMLSKEAMIRIYRSLL
ncbi:MAG TPA: 4-hydroxybutyrate dehydrogenase [Clostridiaceae bacterium]|nr:4-hydroxybutyrate dehydrogenase [Clostridiaceae bacterium]